MAKRSSKKKAFDPSVSPHAPNSKALGSGVWVALLLAAVAFLVYWPSLKSDFVYDAHVEILDEGFITSPANLPAVLSLKVLGMNLILASRPGQMLYLMLIAVVSGKNPFGYHLCSNLLHAANVALLYVLLCRLIATEITGLSRNVVLKIQLAVVAVTLIFALHPIAVESVAEVSFSSSLLVTFFTLLALLAATSFRQENFRVALLTGSVGTLCAFAAVTSKESGITTALLLIVYWFLFRRREARLPWLIFLSAATAVTATFLAARFLLAQPNPVHLHYLGGSFFQVFLIQPRLWTFMMGKLLWPVQFSADYTVEDIIESSTSLALPILIVVVLLQTWLARKSRVGAMGVAIYWLGLVTVSNFTPLFRPLADRFYYLPMAGVAMQLLALLLMTLRWPKGFYLALVPFLIAILPLTFLTLTREDVFANETSLWSDTLQVSPLSSLAHSGLGVALFKEGKVDEAIIQYKKALEIQPTYPEAHNNLGAALMQKEQVDEAIVQNRKALEIRPTYPEAHNNLGTALMQKEQVDEAIIQYEKALEIRPNYSDAHDNLGLAFIKKGQVDEAMSQFKKSLESNSANADAHNNLGVTLVQKGQMDSAMVQFQEAVRLKPSLIDAQNNLAKAKAALQQEAPPGK